VSRHLPRGARFDQDRVEASIYAGLSSDDASLGMKRRRLQSGHAAA